MTCKYLKFYWIVFIIAVWPNPTLAATLPQSFLKGIEHYKSENYAAAIEVFLNIAESGVSNGKLYYDLGNAYFKNNDLGHAMLWYERALRLMPNDPDLKFNLEYAQTRIKDEREVQISPIFRVLFFWKYLLEYSTVKWVAVILNFLFWAIITLDHFLKTTRLKSSAYLILVFAMIFTATAFYNFYERTYLRQAIILPVEVSIRSGLSDDATELFTLHAGTKVTIQKELNDHFRIYFSDGKIGWIKQSYVGTI